MIHIYQANTKFQWLCIQLKIDWDKINIVIPYMPFLDNISAKLFGQTNVCNSIVLDDEILQHAKVYATVVPHLAANRYQMQCHNGLWTSP